VKRTSATNSAPPPLPQPYLAPYVRAASRHGSEFPALLWASPQTQSARFDAIERLGCLRGKSVLDVGCGRADLLEFLLRRGVEPADYIGIEAVRQLAEAAREKVLDSGVRGSVLMADFIREPQRLFAGADVVVFSGSLNTVEDGAFYDTLRRAFDAAAETLVFNFLCNSYLAGAEYLRWRRPQDVLEFARQRTPHVRTLDDYLHGDLTVAMKKSDSEEA
jgi:SAM-dependent methyltransferase